MSVTVEPRSRATADLVRVSLVAATALAQVLGGPVGSALAGGTSQGEVSDRWPTVVTPVGWTFAIWGLVFAGCLAYAVYQALPAQHGRDVHRRVGWPLAVTFVANTVWQLVFVRDGLAVVVGNAVIVVAVAACAVAVARLQAPAPQGLDRLLPGAVAPLLLGWLTFATVANTAITGQYLGAPADGAVATAAGIVALVAAAAVVLDVSLRLRLGNAPFALAAAWGALGVSQADGPVAVTVAAWFAVAVMVVSVPLAVWRYRRADRVLLA